MQSIIIQDLKATEVKAIEDCDLDYFKNKTFNIEHQHKVLGYSIITQNTIMIKGLINLYGAKIIGNRFVLHDLVEKPRTLKTVKLLDELGVDLTVGGYVLIFKSALNKNAEVVEYLTQKINDINHRIINISLVNIFDEIKTKENELKNFIPVLSILLKKVDADNMNQLLEKSKLSKNNKSVILNQFLSLSLKTKEEIIKQKIIKI